jgi:hypothetical protein
VTVTRETIRELAALARRPAVSIQMPTHRAGPGIRQDPIRLKNLLREAERQLGPRGIGADDAARLLAPAHRLTEDRAFWRHQAEGLAVFTAPDFFRAYPAPRPFLERVTVADRFHVVQLLPLAELDSRFYVLALSQKDVRLVEATATSAVEVELPGLPRSLQEALLEDVPDRGLQGHVVSGGGGERGALFHGHAGGLDQRKEQVRQFWHRVDQGLRPFLRDRTAPLVLAGVEYLLPLYRETNTHPAVVPASIPGNPEGLAAEDLRARAWELVRPQLEALRQQAVERYHDLAGTGRASSDVAAVVRAAYEGRVERLFAAVDAERWGAFDPDSGTVSLRAEPAPGTEDLVNLAVVFALERGSAVHAVEATGIPGRGPLAAVFRY